MVIRFMCDEAPLSAPARFNVDGSVFEHRERREIVIECDESVLARMNATIDAVQLRFGHDPQALALGVRAYISARAHMQRHTMYPRPASLVICAAHPTAMVFRDVPCMLAPFLNEDAVMPLYDDAGL